MAQRYLKNNFTNLIRLLNGKIKKTFVKEIDFPIAFANIASLLLEAFSKWRQVDRTGLFNVYFTVRENQFLKRY